MAQEWWSAFKSRWRPWARNPQRLQKLGNRPSQRKTNYTSAAGLQPASLLSGFIVSREIQIPSNKNHHERKAQNTSLLAHRSPRRYRTCQPAHCTLNAWQHTCFSFCAGQHDPHAFHDHLGHPVIGRITALLKFQDFWTLISRGLPSQRP